MNKQKTITLLSYSITGFTIAHGLLSFLVLGNQQLYNTISLHYSDSLTWYILFFFTPLLAGLTFHCWLKNKSLSKGLKILFGCIMILQLAFTITASIVNDNYWGYAFKRPAIFSEILNANNIITCSRVSNIDTSRISQAQILKDTTKSLDNLYGREDLYYGTSDRIFMAFQDKAQFNGHLSDFSKIYNNLDLKISNNILQELEMLIQGTNLIDVGEGSGQLTGFVTEFISKDSTKYIFAGLSGGEVSNDHYPFYEFLFVEKEQKYELIKKQRFYKDVAGIEGCEYANIAPFFSLLLTASNGVKKKRIYQVKLSE